jgi:hypothetical protein
METKAPTPTIVPPTKASVGIELNIALVALARCALS